MVLSLIDADGNAGNGDTAFTFIGDASNPFTAAGQVSVAHVGTVTFIQLNTDADAEADGVIRGSARRQSMRAGSFSDGSSLSLVRQRRKAPGFLRIGMSVLVTSRRFVATHRFGRY